MWFQELLYKLLHKSNTKLLSNNYCSIRLNFSAKGNPKTILLYFVSLADDLVNNAIYYLVIFLSRMLTLDENTLRTLRKCPKLYISLLNCFRTNSLFRIFLFTGISAHYVGIIFANHVGKICLVGC